MLNRFQCLVSIFFLILQACDLNIGLNKNLQPLAPADPHTSHPKAAKPAACNGEPGFYTGSLHAFVQTTGCINCHGQSQAPLFGHTSVAISYAETLPLIDFVTPSNSKLVKKSEDGHCGSICSSSNLMLSSVASWVTGRNSLGCGSVMPTGTPFSAATPATTATATPPNPVDRDVVSFTLINANTNAADPTDGILNHSALILDHSTLNLHVLGSALNVRADVNNAGSVQFNYDQGALVHVENSSPFALASDTNGIYNSWTPTVGNHVLTATAYSNIDATGQAGASFTVHFSVVAGSASTTPTPTALATPAPTAAPATPTIPAVNTQCKAFTAFRQNVKPTMQNKCLSCHAGGAGGFVLPNNDDGALCNAALTKIDTATPANSKLITKPLNHTSHPNIGFGQSDAFPAWTNWISAEK